jgi:lysozyme family protein
MKENFDQCLAAVLHHEGGFVNHPKDPGGMTNLGVTKRVWEEWVGHEVDEKAMRALTPEVVGPMYRKKYWNKVCGDDLPTGLDMAVFDLAVNSGPGRAAKMLQKVLSVPEDGMIGPKTLEKAASIDVGKLVEDYNAQRLTFLQALPTWETFGKGWGRRVAEVSKDAEKMMA